MRSKLHRLTMFKEENIIHTHDALNYHWKVWQWMGIHRPQHISRWLYNIYSIIINLSVTVIFPLTLIANLFFANNMQQLCENLTITVTDVVANVKFINVFFVRKRLLSMKKILARLDRRAAMGSAEERDVLQAAVRTAQNSFRAFTFIFTAGTSLSIVKVVVGKERELLYPAWFYFDWKHSMSVFLLVNAYQLFGLIVQAIQDCANDSYPPAYLCLLAAHMKALEIRVREIGVITSADTKRAGRQLTYEEENYIKLTDCIKDYLDILDLHAAVQYALSTACLAQYVGSALVQCTVAIHFLYVVDSKDFSAQMLSIVFFTAVTLEMFLLCYFGQHMRAQSESLTDAFYSCDWVLQLPKFKQNLVITLARTQHPCLITAGNYFSVDLPTFLQIVKYTYSLFTLLLRFR